MAKRAPRSWGYWTEGKLDILARYLDRFTTTTKNLADARIYLDAFAGEGHGMSRTTRTQFEGSARIGLKVSSPPFDRCYFFELPDKAAELERELTRDFPGRDLRVLPGDCNGTIPDALAELRRDNLDWAPTFAFLDPDGMELYWETIEALAVHKQLRQPPSKFKVELWLLFPSGGLLRNLALDDRRLLPGHVTIRLGRLEADLSGAQGAADRRTGGPRAVCQPVPVAARTRPGVSQVPPHRGQEQPGSAHLSPDLRH
jgi:three-Cys-motif partner protein